MATPTAIKATALRTIEAATAGNPLATMKGATGTIAPSAKRQNEVPAATQAEPPRASGSIPSSSRARVSTARPTSPPMIERAAVLGANDGLVSNLSLSMGGAGASGGGHPHRKAQVGDEAVVGPEDRGPERVAAGRLVAALDPGRGPRG